MGFCSLQHFRNPRSTFRGLSLPATFRLQGLATLLAVFSLESPAGSLSHRLRSWDSPFGGFLSRKVSATFQSGRTHLPLARRLFRRRSVRPARRASVSGSIPPEIALRPHGVLGRRSPAPPLGFAPSGPVGKDLGLTSQALLSRAWHSSPITRRVSPHLRVSIGLRFCPTRLIPGHQSAETTLLGFSHLPAPDH